MLKHRKVLLITLVLFAVALATVGPSHVAQAQIQKISDVNLWSPDLPRPGGSPDSGEPDVGGSNKNPGPGRTSLQGERRNSAHFARARAAGWTHMIWTAIQLRIRFF